SGARLAAVGMAEGLAASMVPLYGRFHTGIQLQRRGGLRALRANLPAWCAFHKAVGAPLVFVVHSLAISTCFGGFCSRPSISINPRKIFSLATILSFSGMSFISRTHALSHPQSLMTLYVSVSCVLPVCGAQGSPGKCVHNLLQARK